MPASKDVKARPVRQQLSARRVELPAGKGATVTVTYIVAREVGAPPGATPIEWRLLTNRTVANDREVVVLIDWCRASWEIEMLFEVLKNACRVEALQLGTIETLERALAKPRLNDVLRLVARLGGDSLAGKAMASPASRPSGLA